MKGLAPRARFELATLRLTAITLYSYGEPFGRVSYDGNKGLSLAGVPGESLRGLVKCSVDVQWKRNKAHVLY